MVFDPPQRRERDGEPAQRAVAVPFGECQPAPHRGEVRDGLVEAVLETEGDAFVERRPCRREVAAGLRYAAVPVQRVSDPVPRSHGPREAEGLRQNPSRVFEVTLEQTGLAESDERADEIHRGAGRFPEDVHALLGHRTDCHRLALEGQERRERGERASPGPCPRGAAPLQRRLEAPAGLTVVPQPEPEPMQRGGQPEGLLDGVGILLEPIGRGPQVPEILREPLLPPLGLVGKERLGGLGPGEEEPRMAAPELRRLARLLQTLPGELPDRLQDAIARLERFGLEHDEGLLHESTEQVQHVRRGERAPLPRRYRLRRFDREPPGEHRQAPEQDLLRLGEQCVAPLDRAAQRALAREGRPAPRGEQPEHVVQPGGDLLRIEDACPRGGQLDGQRKAVEPVTDLRDRGRVSVGQLERRPHRLSPLDEQADRLARRRCCCAADRFAGLGERERRHEPGALASDPERLAARGHDAEPRAASEQRLRQPGARLDQMLAVVQHEQRFPIAQRLEQGVPGRSDAVAAHAQRVGDVVRDELGIRERGELHPGNAVGVLRPHAARHLEGETGLAAPARAGECQEPRALEQLLDGRRLALAADERGELGGRRRARRGFRCFDGLDECRHPAEPLGGRLGQGTGERGGHRLRDIGLEIRDPRRCDREMSEQNALHGRPGEWRPPRQHFVEHARQGVLIAPPVQLPLSSRLLGTHVVRRPNRHTGLRQRRAARPRGGGDRPRDPEVRHHGVSRLKQDVLRLDVAMDHPPLMRVAQRVRHLPRDLQRFLERQPHVAPQPIAQRLPLDVGHHVVENAGRFPGVVHGEYVGVIERGRDLDLAQEALDPER